MPYELKMIGDTKGIDDLIYFVIDAYQSYFLRYYIFSTYLVSKLFSLNGRNKCVPPFSLLSDFH